MDNRPGFFKKNQPELTLEWNSAKKSDWKIIRRNFIAAYLSAYENSPSEKLTLPPKILLEAQNTWESAYQETISFNASAFIKKIIDPLKCYFNHRDTPFQSEILKIENHFSDKSNNIHPVRQYFIQLLSLKNYFDHHFQEEKKAIQMQLKNKKIHYLVVRLHDHPIAFFSSELNYKSARIYLRWATIHPGFHREGLGHLILDQINKEYPHALGIELYTRQVNLSARLFYKRYGFRETFDFQFGKPSFFSAQKNTLYFPDDESTHSIENFVAYHHPNINRFK